MTLMNRMVNRKLACDTEASQTYASVETQRWGLKYLCEMFHYEFLRICHYKRSNYVIVNHLASNNKIYKRHFFVTQGIYNLIKQNKRR